MDFSILTEWRLPESINRKLAENDIYNKVLQMLKKQLLSDDKNQEDSIVFTFFDEWSDIYRFIHIAVASWDGGTIAGVTGDQKAIIVFGPNFWDYATKFKVSPLTALKNVIDHEIFHIIEPSFQRSTAKEKGSGKNYHLREYEIPAWMLTLISSLKTILKTPEQLEKFKQTISLPTNKFVDELRILLYRHRLEKYGRDVFSYWKTHPEVMKQFRSRLYKSFF
jgi:hypothetical protein